MLRLWLAGALMIVGTAAVAADPLTGQFGGDDVRLTLDAAGGRVETGCAAGLLDGPIHTDAQGQFTARGSFEAYQPGPQRADVAPGARQARYSGVVRGSDVELTIAVAGKPPLAFRLTRDRRTKLIRCL